MPQVIIHAFIEFADEATRDEAVRLTAPIELRTRTEEAGCLAYCFAADPCVPNRVAIHELWEDHASLHAHFVHPCYEQMREVLVALKPTAIWNRMYEVGRDSPVYLEGGGIRSRFFEDA
jgi:quinol monooxygenase YgiN